MQMRRYRDEKDPSWYETFSTISPVVGVAAAFVCANNDHIIDWIDILNSRLLHLPATPHFYAKIGFGICVLIWVFGGLCFWVNSKLYPRRPDSVLSKTPPIG